jgi:Rrf2 family transcriptional regulator, nitric oxide-sensitive transcriptional repressor
MQLTRYTDYSLRVLTFLALQPESLATIEEVSDAFGISRGHLMKVVHELGQAGFVETLRGRGGGIRLARPAQDITVGDVVRLAEGKMVLVECFDPETSHCRIETVCGLRPILDEALGAFMETLDRHSLADLVARRRKPLTQLLAF